MNNKIDYSWFNWGPFLMHTFVSDEIINGLLERGKKLDKEKNDFRHTLAGNLETELVFNAEDNLWFMNSGFREILQIYKQGWERYHTTEPKNVKLGLTKLWINYMKKGDYNPPHVHTGDLSFVIYLDMPDELVQENKDFVGTSAGPGAITFQYGEASRPFWKSNTQIVLPQRGSCYIFPALLSHHVAPFKSDVTRISVSGNVTAVEQTNDEPNFMSRDK